MEFELWHIWLLIALISFIMEIFIPSFILFNFGIGALVGSLAAGLNLSIESQIVLFSSGYGGKSQVAIARQGSN